MLTKEKIRRKFLQIRKKNYYEVSENFFDPLIILLNKKFAPKQII